jgi:transcriptional regulator with XRE-family HTH domain
VFLYIKREVYQVELLDKQIGEKLRKLRESKNLTTREVAEAIGITHSYVSRIENGKAPSLDKLKKLCDFYHVDVSFLFGDKNEPDDGLKKLGVEWIAFAEDMKDKDISPEEIKQTLIMLKLLKKL